jgi:hypothetical protein
MVLLGRSFFLSALIGTVLVLAVHRKFGRLQTVFLRAIAGKNFRGKSGLHRVLCRLTAGLGCSKRSGRKVPQKTNRFFADGGEVRVKRCGKSAPRGE